MCGMITKTTIICVLINILSTVKNKVSDVLPLIMNKGICLRYDELWYAGGGINTITSSNITIWWLMFSTHLDQFICIRRICRVLLSDMPFVDVCRSLYWPNDIFLFLFSQLDNVQTNDKKLFVTKATKTTSEASQWVVKQRIVDKI